MTKYVPPARYVFRMNVELFIERTRRVVAARLGAKPYLAFLRHQPYLEVLPAILTQVEDTSWGAIAESSSYVPTIGGPDVEEWDWQGSLETSIPEGRIVFVKRIPDPDGRTFTLIGAGSEKTVREFCDLALQRYHRWRLGRHRLQTGTGADIKEQPARWEDVILPAPLLQDVRDTALGFATAQDLYARLGIPYRRGLLFHGAPGNGKTMLCRAIVTSLGWPVSYVSPRGSNRCALDVETAMSTAADLAPSVLIFEDVDSLFEDRATLSPFLNLLDGFTAKEGVLILATTNHPEKLDAALTSRPSRFDRIFAISEPGRAEREVYLAHLFAQVNADLDYVALAAATDGFSMAFLKEVFVGSALRAAGRGETAPTADDVDHVVALMTEHRKDGAHAFAPSRDTGFRGAQVG